MGVFAVVDIGDPCKPSREPFTHVSQTLKTCSPQRTATPQIKHSVISEERHDGVQIVRVERVKE